MPSNPQQPSSPPQPRCNVSNLLVVTFTEAAASEMKSRIESALRQRLDSTPDDAHVRRQFALLEHIHCSTLHSFCNRLLRQHFHRLGLDPNFRVLDADEASLLRLEIVRDLFSDRYDHEDSAAFHRFIDSFGDGRDGRDDSLMSLVLDTHAMLTSLVDPMTWIDRSLWRISQAATEPLESSEPGLEYITLIRSGLYDLDRDTSAAITALSRMTGFQPYVAHLQYLAQTLSTWTAALDSTGYDALVTAVRDTEFQRLPSIRNSTPGKESASQLVSSVQKQFKEGPLIQALRFSSAEFQTGLRSIAPHAEVFLDLVLDFGRRYRKHKDSLRALDFSDLERFTLRLLSEPRSEIENRKSKIPAPLSSHASSTRNSITSSSTNTRTSTNSRTPS
ncbi:MAG: UvrD-helicase domain-containing protein [Planctomycetota bacterium]|nr:UvrD-helicase domain-containing protein [Planctomycetota bacterium]